MCLYWKINLTTVGLTVSNDLKPYKTGTQKVNKD